MVLFLSRALPISSTRLSLSLVFLPRKFDYLLSLFAYLGLFSVRSPLLGESITFFLFFRLLRCFSSPAFPSYIYLFQYMMLKVCLSGFPPFGHPWFFEYLLLTKAFAACRVLLRLSVPRHSPCAFCRLTGYIITEYSFFWVHC